MKCPGWKREAHDVAAGGFHLYKYSGKARKHCKECLKAQKREWNATAAKQRGKTHALPYYEAPSEREEAMLAVPVGLRPYSTVVAIGDIHEPFAQEYAKAQALIFIKDVQPEYVVQGGDLYDLYSFSRYPRSLNVMTPRAEMMEGREKAELWWAAVHKAAPNAKCYQLWGNHDSRAQRRTLEQLPSAEDFVVRGMRDLMTFQGVNLVTQGEAAELYIDGVRYMHTPAGSKVGDTLAEERINCVTFHTHVGGVAFRGYEDRITWELGAGWLGDRRQPCFSYAARRRAHRTTLGVGLITPLGPQFCPLEALPK